MWQHNNTFDLPVLTLRILSSDSFATNAAFCPKYWVRFRTSCYKAVKSLKAWDESLATCKRENGATLASLDDKHEEDYVKSIMKSNGLNKFHVLGRSGTAASKRGFMCEYKLGKNGVLKLLYLKIRYSTVCAWA